MKNELSEFAQWLAVSSAMLICIWIAAYVAEYVEVPEWATFPAIMTGVLLTFSAVVFSFKLTDRGE